MKAINKFVLILAISSNIAISTEAWNPPIDIIPYEEIDVDFHEDTINNTEEENKTPKWSFSSILPSGASVISFGKTTIASATKGFVGSSLAHITATGGSAFDNYVLALKTPKSSTQIFSFSSSISTILFDRVLRLHKNLKDNPTWAERSVYALKGGVSLGLSITIAKAVELFLGVERKLQAFLGVKTLPFHTGWHGFLWGVALNVLHQLDVHFEFFSEKKPSQEDTKNSPQNPPANESTEQKKAPEPQPSTPPVGQST